nr:MAG TPA: hypothetical protein [Caudoviricetes sp.]
MRACLMFDRPSLCVLSARTRPVPGRTNPPSTCS